MARQSELFERAAECERLMNLTSDRMKSRFSGIAGHVDYVGKRMRWHVQRNYHPRNC
jgi:hypothetical protein